MEEVFKTIGSEGGTKQHIIKSVDENSREKEMVCDIGVDPDDTDRHIWLTQDDILDADEVCANCKDGMLVDSVEVKTYSKNELNDAYYDFSHKESNTGDGVLSKIISAVPWV